MAHKIQTDPNRPDWDKDKKWSCQEGKITAIYICRLVASNMSSQRFPAIYVQNDAPSAFRIDRYTEDLFRVGSHDDGAISFSSFYHFLRTKYHDFITRPILRRFGSYPKMFIRNCVLFSIHIRQIILPSRNITIMNISRLLAEAIDVVICRITYTILCLKYWKRSNFDHV